MTKRRSKTTLFTAIQVCLYGNFAFGFKTSGKRYLAEIYDLINDQVRIEKNASAFVEIDFEQVDNTDLFNYTIRRTWTWPQNTICENLAVWKNGCRLEEEDSRGLLKSISDYLLDQKWEHFEPLFGLSSDEEGQVQSVLSRVSTFDSQVLNINTIGQSKKYFVA